jgi:hypothetical protein
MYSIPDPASIFDVFYFSNEVERIGEEVSAWWAAGWLDREWVCGLHLEAATAAHG